MVPQTRLADLEVSMLIYVCLSVSLSLYSISVSISVSLYFYALLWSHLCLSLSLGLLSSLFLFALRLSPTFVAVSGYADTEAHIEQQPIGQQGMAGRCSDFARVASRPGQAATL